ncbi:hypothetical protein C5167_026744 [Papaver somniferum]|nr:hypothetical protein C5167_026744 [Papaver somniferum]
MQLWTSIQSVNCPVCWLRDGVMDLVGDSFHKMKAQMVKSYLQLSIESLIWFLCL